MQEQHESRQDLRRQGSETILLADDEDDLRKAATEYLERCGYRVLTAKTGREAMDICDGYEGEIALFVSDIMMPKVSGPALVAHVLKARPATKVIVISGFADDQMTRHGDLLKSASFLQKP